MTGLAGRIIALAASELPEPESSRRLEEWSADLAGARDAGVSRASIAAGAALFAARSPLANPIAADRWSRWSLLTASLGPALWIALVASGLFWEPGFQDAGLITAVVAGLVAIALGAGAWRRSGGSAWTVWGTGGSVILLCLSVALWGIGPSDSALFWAPVSLAAAGLIVVGVSLMAHRARRRQGAAVIVTATIPGMIWLRDLLEADQLWMFTAFVPAMGALVLLTVTLRRRRAS